MLIFLVGFMGCGKSTIGRRVARRLGYDFVDMDQSIEQAQGRAVSEIFASQGEQAFRAMERAFLEELPDRGDMIVATGGGAPCFGDNMTLMKNKGSVVYFKMLPEGLLGRLLRGRDRRPKIAGMSDGQLLDYITATLAVREPYYMQSSMVIDCAGVSDEYIAGHIEHFIVSQHDNDTI